MKKSFQITSRFNDIFSIDKRAMGVFRICFGFIVLLNIIGRLPFLELHLTETGLLPYSTNLELFYEYSRLSLFHLLGDGFVVPLIILYIASTLLFIFGYYTRLSTVLLWLLMMSLHGRNELVCYGAEHYLRAFIFWCMFLPLGDYYSFDSSTKKSKASVKLLNGATVIFVIQIAIVYFFAGILKSGEQWHKTGTALYMALNTEHLTSNAGRWLLNFPNFLKAITPSVVVIEVLGSLLLFCPFYIWQVRILLVALLFSLHLGIIIFQNLYLIPYVSLSLLIVLLPTQFWDWVSEKVKSIFQSRTFSQNKRSSGTSQFKVNLKNSLPLVLIISLLVLVNLESYNKETWKVPKSINSFLNMLRLDQNWSFFAPFPYNSDGWFEIKAMKANGTWGNLWVDPTLNKNEFERRLSHWGNVHQMAMLEKIRFRVYEYSYSNLSNYLCNSFKSNPTEDKFKKIEIQFYLRWKEHDGVINPPQKEVVYSQDCY